MYEPEELVSLLDDEGWTATIEATRWFIFGEARVAQDFKHGRDALHHAP
jgi:hypothetical protein